MEHGGIEIGHALQEEWIADFFFDDAPFLGKKERQDSLARGVPGVLQMKKNEQGIWEGKRDIVLGKNISAY